MELKEIAALGGVGILLTLVQVSPIRINPWSFLWGLVKKGLRAMGRSMNGEVMEEVAELKTEMTSVQSAVNDVRKEMAEMKEESMDTAMVNVRARILRFGDELLHKVRHSKDHFDSVLRDAHNYEEYCKDHENFENGVTEPTIQRIRDVYKECLEKNDFL